ncbi:MAG: ABC transporter ATP-binding protein, partial [Chloroflexi bacterium]
MGGDRGPGRADERRGFDPARRVDGGARLRLGTANQVRPRAAHARRLDRDRERGPRPRRLRAGAIPGMGGRVVRVPLALGPLRRPSRARGLPSALHPGGGVAAARLTHLTYAYPGSARPALADVSVELDGGLTLVVGPSGGGKSTLLRVLNGLVPHFHGGSVGGAAESAGFDVIATPTRVMARSVGFVFQDPELQAVYDTVEREVAFGLENLGVPPRAMPARIEAALAEVGASHLLERRLSTLSGGER